MWSVCVSFELLVEVRRLNKYCLWEENLFLYMQVFLLMWQSIRLQFRSSFKDTMGYSIKKLDKEVEDVLFWKTPGNFHFYPFGLEIPDSSTPGNPQNCVRSFGISNVKTKTPGNSTLFFLVHPRWKRGSDFFHGRLQFLHKK